MNTKKEIVKFLEELAIGVQGKRDDLEVKMKKRLKVIPFIEDEDVYWDFRNALLHTEGQLYEINYILETITRDKRKKV